jgi:asparagine synthase (glutamine-hydrolysing)
MQAQSSRPVKTFSIGFHESAYNEATHARAVASHLGTQHTELYVTAKDALDVVPLLSSMYDEPLADTSQIPTHLVSRLARQHVTVSLSGDGGDELFGGYSHYGFIDSTWRVVKKVPVPFRGATARAIRSLPDGAVNRLLAGMERGRSGQQPAQKLRTLADFLAAGTPEAIYLYAISQWREPERLVTGSHEPGTVFEVLSKLRSLPTATEMAMVADLVFYLPDDILTKVDRASMAVGLEARVPLLDHRVVEFVWKLPLNLKIRNGQSKWLLRQVLYRHVPPSLVERPKMGFGVPIDSWLRGPLREWAEDLLSHEGLRRSGYLEAAPIRAKWQEHLSGARNWDCPLWNALIFQDWQAASRRKTGSAELTEARAN